MPDALGAGVSKMQYSIARSSLVVCLLALSACDNDRHRGNVAAPAPSADASLATLTVSAGQLAPAFTAATTAYTVTVEYSVASVTVSATAADAGARVNVNGGGTGSAAVPLAVGNTSVTVQVTAADNATTRNYTITLTREPAALSNNADLASLVLSSGNLDPAFDAAVADYAATVGFATASVTLTPVTADPGATVTVDGAAVVSGESSAPIALAEGLNSFQVVVTAEDGQTTRSYSVAVTRLAAVDADVAQAAYLKAATTQDFFGRRLALDADTLAVGVEWDDSAATGISPAHPDPFDNSAANAGAVYVFVRRSDGSWEPEAYLKASNAAALDFFGASLALDGDTLVVGAPGEDSASTGTAGDPADDAAIDAGAVYVFTRSAGTWTQQAYLKASNTDAGDRFGQNVALHGDTLVVTATHEDSAAVGVDGDEADDSAEDAGAAYVFTRAGDVWTQQAYLKASNAEAGDLFGRSVAVHGDSAAVSAEREASAATGIDGDQSDNSASGAGAVYVFTRDGGGAWGQQAYIKASNTATGDQFGGGNLGSNGLALSGDILLVGARGEDSAATGIDGDQANNALRDSGAVYAFARTSGAWFQTAYIKASNPGIDDWFGASLDFDGEQMIAAARNEGSAATGLDGDQADESAPGAGAAYLFAISAGQWTQQHYVKASNAESSDFFGSSVGISQGRFAVGAEQEASTATGVDGDQSDNGAIGSGAVYLFEPVP